MKIRILLALLSVIGLVVLTACDSSKPKSVGSPENVTISTYAGDHSALLWIAKDRGYFSEHGVNVEIETQESGPASLRDLLAGKVDLAAFAEFVFVRHIFEHPEIRTLAVVAQLDNYVQLVARKDHGITGVSELRNKRIGLVRNSAADYFLHIFLKLHQIPYQDIKVVDLPPSEQVKAIILGDIDAAIVWKPFCQQMENELGKKRDKLAGSERTRLLLGTRRDRRHIEETFFCNTRCTGRTGFGGRLHQDSTG